MTRTVLAIAGILLLAASPGFALDVTVCGQVVPDGNTGVLQMDLDCSSDPGDSAVTLGNRAVLDMNGHSIIARNHGVFCGGEPSSGCEVRNGDISGGNYGILGNAKRMIVSDVSVHDVATQAITASKRLALTNVTVLRSDGNGIVVPGGQIRATNIVVSENGRMGMDAKKILGTDVTASLNGFGGVSCQKCVLTGLTALDNGTSIIMVGAGAGVQAIAAKISDATITGNFVDGVPVDIDTFRRPRLSNTTCEHSRQRDDPSSSWGVCTAD